MFDNTALQPFMELSDTIKGYVEETRQATGGNRAATTAALDQLNARLLESIAALAKRRSFKDVL
jgi:hypothetical protein